MKFETSHWENKTYMRRGLFSYKESEILDFPCPFPVSNIKIPPIPSSFSSLKEKQNQMKFAQEPQVTHNSRDSLIPRVTQSFWDADPSATPALFNSTQWYSWVERNRDAPEKFLA